MSRFSCKFAALASSAIVAFNTSNAIADSATLYSGWKSIGEWREVGEGRSYWLGIYWGVSHNVGGEGMGHEMAWNCPAAAQIADGTLTSHGYCTMVDPDGDKIFAEFEGKADLGEQFRGHQDYTGGSGKYEGIEGGHTFDCRAIGTDQFACRQDIEYTLR
jgi:hypothetical protein